MKIPAHFSGSGGDGGNQLELFDRPSFSPTYPKYSSLAGKALTLLLDGYHLTHPEFKKITGSWRLAAYVHILINLGWPVGNIEIIYSIKSSHRMIAKYFLPDWVLQEIRGEFNVKTF